MNNRDELSELLERSIDLELSVSSLYGVYSRLFDDDRDFWWNLSLEEKNHAALLKSARIYLSINRLPDEALLNDIEAIRSSIELVDGTINKYKSAPPSMDDAYVFAKRLEDMASELHLQKIVSVNSDDRILKIFHELGKGDANHALRIKSLLLDKGMRLKD